MFAPVGKHISVMLLFSLTLNTNIMDRYHFIYRRLLDPSSAPDPRGKEEDPRKPTTLKIPSFKTTSFSPLHHFLVQTKICLINSSNLFNMVH